MHMRRAGRSQELQIKPGLIESEVGKNATRAFIVPGSLTSNTTAMFSILSTLTANGYVWRMIVVMGNKEECLLRNQFESIPG